MIFESLYSISTGFRQFPESSRTPLVIFHSYHLVWNDLKVLMFKIFQTIALNSRYFSSFLGFFLEIPLSEFLCYLHTTIISYGPYDMVHVICIVCIGIVSNWNKSNRISHYISRSFIGLYWLFIFWQGRIIFSLWPQYRDQLSFIRTIYHKLRTV